MNKLKLGRNAVMAIILIIGLLIGLVGCNAKTPTNTTNQAAAGTPAAWVAPGQLDTHYMFASGGQSGNLIVWGIPSMRILRQIPVYNVYAPTGFGFTPETKKMLGDKTWGDVHHPIASQTQGAYDGKFIWVNDKANSRVAQVDLNRFETTQILDIPNMVGFHCLTTDPESKYLFCATEFSLPIAEGQKNAYAPLQNYTGEYYGIITALKTNRDKVQPGQPGQVSISYQLLAPPYEYDISSAGKGAADGLVFFTNYNSEMATSDIEKNSTTLPLDLTLVVDYNAAQKLADAGTYDQVVNGVKIIDPRKHPGIAYLLPIAKNPHGVDVSPDGKWIVYSSKLDPVVTIISTEKLKKAIASKNFEKTTWGLPVLKEADLQEAQIQVGVGPLHTQFDDQGYAYTSLFVESAVTKWQLGSWKVIDKQPVNYNVGHVAVPGGDSMKPFGHWLVALNKASLKRFLPVGPSYPVSEQLFDISGSSKMTLVNETPSEREPHYASIFPANLIKPISVYPKDESRPNSIWSEDKAKIVRNGNQVTVYMLTIRSHFKPDTIEVNQGDHVTIYLTNIEQQPGMTHGIGMSGYNINVPADPGQTVQVDFTADKPGTFPFYCTNFCSAMHEEMAGYFLVKPKS
ncbi:MAG: Sec-dependent nitrous-oxide reductase [Bacillota bacterium]|nr:Sec-dependent nitrous-oxide reductase [Bacillota bacterium]MDP4159176.1 Sec-dependent nitrous-oxide reductase [Bacillota bacterium]